MSNNLFLNTKVKPGTKEAEQLLWALEISDHIFTTEDGAQLRDGKKYDEIYRKSDSQRPHPNRRFG